MPVILSNIAAAVAALGKQVTLVNVASSTETGREADAAPDAGRVILETTDADNGKAGAACEVLPSGIRLLHVDDTSPAGGATAGNIELLHNMGDVIDYLLVDLPFRPTPFARLSFLSGTSRRRARFGTPI
jgi:hypothetical protein